MKRITVLGSTGSIGTQTLEVARTHPEEFSVEVMTCGHNTGLFRKQLAEFRPKLAVCADEADVKALSAEFPGIPFMCGTEGLIAAAEYSGSDIVVNSLLGMMGIEPTYRAIKAGRDIAFANKETLVAAGSLIMQAVSESGINFLPVDSEHSAIFQSIQGAAGNPVRRILLTASGGPFRGKTYDELKNVTKAQALKHPNWSMGAKITIDSATMMNKGLEIIEASWLFSIPPERIDVYVHPESVLHSAVEFMDGAVIGQMGTPDMKLPIAYALSWPRRLGNISGSLDLFRIGTLHFEKPDPETFRCLGLAYRAIEAGGSYTLAMNAANEEAVAAFLNDRITFVQIAETVESVLNAWNYGALERIGDIPEMEKEARRLAKEKIERLQ